MGLDWTHCPVRPSPVKQTWPWGLLKHLRKSRRLRPGLWSCPICTFDNEESMSACDICGVLRNPMVSACSNGNKNTVDGMSKYSGASIMAKSLFASLPLTTPNKTLTSQHQNDKFLMDACNSFPPFKFDVPSPDDLVSNGLRSSKVVSKANVNKLSFSDVTSSVTEKKTAMRLPPNAKGFDSSSAFVSENKHGSVEEDTCSPLNGGQPQNLSSGLNNLSSNLKSGSSKNVNAGRALSSAQYKPEKWMLPDPAEDRLTQLNLAIVGHVDSGKSTLSGRLLHLSGRISQKEMHKYEKEAKLQGKGSFAYAWALDESAEERERGITMTVAVAYFDSKRYHVVLLDSPGHKDFVPNMISGAAQADAAILVIDASVGSFEAGMDSTGGQTREHAQLIRSFGAAQVIVAINKMDVVEYSKERFDTIKTQVGAFLRSCGFKDSSVSWVPLSAIENQNLVATASEARLLSWCINEFEFTTELFVLALCSRTLA
ncbi:translation elongation factor EF1A/initiation factor IF2gamma family protein [Actinidia rufa]|uniref:Translation elongation factor EF1A/initiation factor IF2gamma family protein n=1 Tax=Actinidia rufa TaxID=165716 RepID=A0A7J0DTF2_9ERIC|nr:translation elongation factor EF1A/initiation factor IF2gamma family protein [Actinidia rufa]